MRHFFCIMLMSILVAGCSGVTIDMPGQVSETSVTPEPSQVEPDPTPESASEVLFFTQPDCPPCEEVKPKVEELRRQGVKITTINIREQRELARQYRITATPTFVVLQDGVEIERTGSITVLITILVKLLAFLLPLMLG